MEAEHPGDDQGSLTDLLLPFTSREGLRFDGYLKYPPVAKALYFYEYPCLHRYSKQGATAQQSTSLTIIPDGILLCLIIGRQFGIVVSDADCCAVGPGFESGRRHG
ncbi:hypothetical protein TNCV_2474621 [Trichonephila clavipes]|nr:hypothetical protein TNCV_2474621 [Trichonephila clavipes]